MGWVLRGGTSIEPKPAPAEALVTKSSRPRKDLSEKPPYNAEWLALGKRAKGLGNQEREKAVKELDPKDRIAALEALASQAGLNGLDYQVKSLMEKILENWAIEDFDGAWQAARATSNRDLADFMMKEVLGQLAKTDPDRAFAIHLEQKAVDPNFYSNAPKRILDAKLKLGAADYVEILKQLPFGGNCTGSTVEFASDFDFQFAADGFAKLKAEQANKNPATFPTNFYSEWAKRDPEAAFASWATNGSLPFNDLDGILKGMETQSPGTSAVWLAEKLQDPAISRVKVVEGLTELDTDLPSRISAVANALPDDAASDGFLTEFLASFPYSDPLTKCSFAVSELSTPAARLQAFQAMKSKHRAPDVRKINDAQLAAWGITRQQAEQAFAK